MSLLIKRLQFQACLVDVRGLIVLPELALESQEVGSLTEEFCLQRCKNFRAGDDATTSQGASHVCWKMTEEKPPSGPGPRPVRERTLKNRHIITSKYGVTDLGASEEGLMTHNSKSVLVQSKLSDGQTPQRASGPSMRVEMTGTFAWT